MTTRIFTSLGLLTLLATSSAYAQSARLTADIPFSFHAGNSVLPAGHYSVYTNIRPGIVLFRCLNVATSAMIITTPASANQPPAQGELEFRRYGNAYFFANVWTAGQVVGRALPASKAEREFQLSRSPAHTEEVAALAAR